MALLNAQLWYWLHWPVSSMTRIFGSAAWAEAVSRTNIERAAVNSPTNVNKVFIVFRQVANVILSLHLFGRGWRAQFWVRRVLLVRPRGQNKTAAAG